MKFIISIFESKVASIVSIVSERWTQTCGEDRATGQTSPDEIGHKNTFQNFIQKNIFDINLIT